jgi:hypothetical protein
MKLIVCILASSLALTSIHAQDGAAAAPKRSLLKYTPPKSATGGARIDGDGGSRGPDVKLPSIYVLAPNGIGQTTSEHPSLYWFQSGPAPKSIPARIEITVVDPKKSKPLLKVGSALADGKDGGAGIHRLPLAKNKVTLDPGVTYKWTVALVPDPANRSQDVIASGTLLRLAPSKELSAALSSPGADKASVYAQNGMWYDALDALTERIDSDPKSGTARAERAELLGQVGLKDAAAFDKKQGAALR